MHILRECEINCRMKSEGPKTGLFYGILSRQVMYEVDWFRSEDGFQMAGREVGSVGGHAGHDAETTLQIQVATVL